MLLNYELDLSPQSQWLTVTPHSVSYELPFYVTEIGFFHAKSQYFTERKNKNTFLFLYTLSGEGSLYYDDNHYILPPHSLIILDCKSYHYYKSSSKEPWIFRWIHFNGVSAKTYVDLISDGKFNIIYALEPSVLEINFQHLMNFEQVNDIYHSLCTSSYISNILLHMLESKFNNTNDKKYIRHKGEIDKVITFIHSNYNKSININDFTNIIHVSKYHFIRLFKQYIGITPYEYLLNYRITQAKILLRNSQLSVGEIALSVGFFSESNFIKQFKKIANMTPLTYRKSFG